MLVARDEGRQGVVSEHEGAGCIDSVTASFPAGATPTPKETTSFPSWRRPSSSGAAAAMSGTGRQ